MAKNESDKDRVRFRKQNSGAHNKKVMKQKNCYGTIIKRLTSQISTISTYEWKWRAFRGKTYGMSDEGNPELKDENVDHNLDENEEFRENDNIMSMTLSGMKMLIKEEKVLTWSLRKTWSLLKILVFGE